MGTVNGNNRTEQTLKNLRWAAKNDPQRTPRFQISAAPKARIEALVTALAQHAIESDPPSQEGTSPWETTRRQGRALL